MIRNRLPKRSFTLYCVRHGESQANAREHGHETNTDSALSGRGQEQATLLAPWLKPLDITHSGSSDLLRARQTIGILRTELGEHVQELTPSPLLRELSRGNDATSGYPDSLRQLMNVCGPLFYRSTNGDSMADIATNYLDWVIDVALTAEELPLAHPRILLVGHGNGIKALWSALTHADPGTLEELRNTSVTSISYDLQRMNGFRSPWSALSYGEAPHLGLMR